ETATGSSLEHTEDVADQINDRLSAYEDIVEMSYASIGGDELMGGAGNTATFTMQLIPASDRDQTTTEIIQEMDNDLGDIPGADITVSAMEEGMGMGDPISIELSGPEHETLSDLADQVVDNISEVQ